MKVFNKLLILSLAVVLAGSCTKLQESPEPGTSSNSNSSGGGGGGGNTGDPDVYIGLWKLTGKTLEDGTDIYDVNDYFVLKLDVAATATWTYYIGGTAGTPVSDSYILNTSSTPATVTFTDEGTRTVTQKTGSIIKWEYDDPDVGNLRVIETLTKQ